MCFKTSRSYDLIPSTNGQSRKEDTKEALNETWSVCILLQELKKKKKKGEKSVKLNPAQRDKMGLSRDVPVKYKGCYCSQYGQDTIYLNADHITQFILQILDNRSLQMVGIVTRVGVKSLGYWTEDLVKSPVITTLGNCLNHSYPRVPYHGRPYALTTTS